MSTHFINKNILYIQWKHQKNVLSKIKLHTQWFHGFLTNNNLQKIKYNIIKIKSHLKEQ